LFLAAVLVITASMALGALTAPAQATPPARSASAPANPALTLVRAVTGTVSFMNLESVLIADENPGIAQPNCLGVGANREAGDWLCTMVHDQAWDLGRRWGKSPYYELVNKKGQCLGVSGASKKKGARVVGWTCIASHPDQYWGFAEPTGTTFKGSYAIINLNSKYVLGVAGASDASGAAIVQWRWQGETNQAWRPCLSTDSTCYIG
jgi:hypothetical protein